MSLRFVILTVCLSNAMIWGADSPVAEFRGWLQLTPQEQAAAVAARPASQRDAILVKLKEYSRLAPEVRESRLRLAELSWFVRPLMIEPATNRAAGLSKVPEPIRPLAEDRLKQWDSLPAAVQQEILGNEASVQYFIRLRSGNSAEALLEVPAENRPRLEQRLQKWEALPAAQREKMAQNLNNYFELSSKEKEKTLQAFSDQERVQMQKTLEAFEKLSPEQRQACISSFSRLASMAPEERTQFLRNTERWQTLPPAERTAWRDLVKALPTPPATEPPMPKP